MKEVWPTNLSVTLMGCGLVLVLHGMASKSISQVEGGVAYKA